MPDTTLENIRRFSDDQYSTEHRLNARIRIYDYCERNDNLQRWIFEKLDFTGVKDVLDLGCGNGLLWKRNALLIPEGIRITLSDISEGMVSAARESLRESGQFRYQVADACHTPFEDSTFQIILANHMLYHIEDKDLVFAEINRLLTDDGCAYASTLTIYNFLELFRLADDFDRRLSFEADDIVSNFSLENGEDILSVNCNVIEKCIYENDVVTADAESLILYLASCYTPEQLEVLIDRYNDFKAFISSNVGKTGQLRMTNKAVLFKFRKK